MDKLIQNRLVVRIRQVDIEVLLLGIYYFLFEILVQPLEHTTMCGTNSTVTVHVSFAEIVAQSVSGLARHFSVERKQKERERGQERDETT